MKGAEMNTAHSRQPPCGDPCRNSRIAARGQAKTRLDFSVHLSVNRKRRNTKQRIDSKEYERRTQDDEASQNEYAT